MSKRSAETNEQLPQRVAQMTESPYQVSRVSAAEPGRVCVGSHVVIEMVTGSAVAEQLAFDVVPDTAADFDAGFLGAGTPLARALLGQQAGSVVPYDTADVTEVRILAVRESTRTPSSDAAANRRAVIEKAVSKSDLADAQRLALTVDVKWGDYDPEGIEESWDA